MFFFFKWSHCCLELTVGRFGSRDTSQEAAMAEVNKDLESLAFPQKLQAPSYLTTLVLPVPLVLNTVFSDHQMPRSLLSFPSSLRCHLHRGSPCTLFARHPPSYSPSSRLFPPITYYCLLFHTVFIFVV